MSRYMTTTVRLPEGLLEQAKAEAKRRGETLTSLIELGLRLVLAQKDEPAKKRYTLPVSSARGGPHPGIDISNSAQLDDIMWEGFKE